METTLTRPKVLASTVTAPAGITREEFDGVVRAHQRRIYRVLLGLVRDPDAADTLTQECFLRAFKKRKSFRREASVGTWLVRIAVNLARDYGRSRKIAFWRRLFGQAKPEEAAAAADQMADARASPERALAAREELEAVWSVVGALSPQQRTAFMLRFAEEMTLEEVAAAMALEVGTVKAHLARAVGAVRRRLKESRGNATSSDR
ncbi:MAG: sigma-70 family RNA polymerase sigma factor [Acidobacteria bacterium]|nr:sigma-70 family RNA polymerase sigma factor [Acidobacteriota bacterium]